MNESSTELDGRTTGHKTVAMDRNGRPLQDNIKYYHLTDVYKNSLKFASRNYGAASDIALGAGPWEIHQILLFLSPAVNLDRYYG